MQMDRDNASSNNPALLLGKRLRYLRKLAQLSIVDFAGLADVSNPSMSYWENGQIGRPIRAKSMTKILQGFKRVGIQVTERWLRTGEGEFPSYKGEVVQLEEEEDPTCLASIDKEESLDTSFPLTQIAANEIKLFMSVPLTVVVKVEHSLLMPFVNQGDLIGGIWQKASSLIEPTMGIVKLNNQLTVAGIKPSEEADQFAIFYFQALNQAWLKAQTELVSLYKVAPILRVWRSLGSI
jgi:transcriptional regulator with XRE-family HTH domain